MDVLVLAAVMNQNDAETSIRKTETLISAHKQELSNKVIGRNC